MAPGAIMVFALASDPPTATRVATEVARQFTEQHVARNGSIFVPQSNWGLADYMRQCFYDPNTLGGVLLYPVVTQSAADNYLAGTRTWLKIDMYGMFLDCPHSPIDKDRLPIVTVPAITFPGAFTGLAGRNNISILPLAGIVSAVNAIGNNKGAQTSTTTTSNFPTPVPTPSPAPGVPAPPIPSLNPNATPFPVSQSQMTTTTKNPDINVATAAFLSTLGTGATIGQLDLSGHLTAIAAGRAVEPFAGSANAFVDRVCGAPSPSATPVPSGSARPVPTPTPFYCKW